MDHEDLVSESAVIAGLYQYGIDAYLDVTDILNEKCFSEGTNLAIYQCMKKVFQDGAEVLDMSLLRSAACTLGFEYIFINKTEAQYLKSVLNTKVALENVKTFAGKLRKLVVLEELKKLTLNIHDKLDEHNGTEPFTTIISSVENPLFEYIKGLNNSDDVPVSFGQEAKTYLEIVEQSPVEICGISTGFSIMDSVIGGGMRPGSCCLLGGRSKNGKSITSLNIGWNVASRNIHTLYLDLEMTARDHLPRLISRVLFDEGHKIPIIDIERGTYTKSSYQKRLVHEVKDRIIESPFKYLNVAGKKIEHISSIIKRWLMTDVKDNASLVIFDYIRMSDLSELKNNIQERQVLQHMIVTLNDVAMKYQIPIFVLTQLNRDAITNEHTGIIVGSDAILYTVANFSIIKFKSAEEIAMSGIDNGNRKIVNLATRFGSGNEPGDFINYQLHGAYAKLQELNLNSNLMAKKQEDKKQKENKNKEENLNLGTL